MTVAYYTTSTGALERLVLADPDVVARIAYEQTEAAVYGRCSVCEAPADRDELDASGRCLECQP